MSDPRDAYDLEPDKPETPPQPRPAGTPTPPSGKPPLDRPSLLEGFEEDADFDKDPELERVITGKAERTAAAAAVAEDTRPEFGKPLGSNPVHWAIAGGVLLVGAMIATGVNYDSKRFLMIVLTLYIAALHTGTGIVAAYIAAILTSTRVKNFELTAARIFAAVCAFLFVFRLNINLFGAGQGAWALEELVLATLVYVGIIAASFRLKSRNPLLFLIGAQFILWLVVQVGMELSRNVGDVKRTAAIKAGPQPIPPPAPAPLSGEP